MILPIVAVVLGLGVLVWSADKFVDGAVGIAKFCGMSTLLIGMVIVGFGTSAPEMVVSAISAMQNAPELALGNAYGSNIANIALILGLTAARPAYIACRDGAFHFPGIRCFYRSAGRRVAVAGVCWGDGLQHRERTPAEEERCCGRTGRGGIG